MESNNNIYNLDEDIFYVIDRIEEGFAVLIADSGQRLELPAGSLPPGAGEGTALRYADGSFIADEEETRRRYQRIGRLLKRLLDKNNGDGQNNFDKNH